MCRAVLAVGPLRQDPDVVFRLPLGEGGVARPDPARGAAVHLDHHGRQGRAARFACSTMIAIASSVSPVRKVDFQ